MKANSPSPPLKNLTLALLAGAAFITGNAHAQNINVNLENGPAETKSTLVGPGGGSGETWNQIVGGSGANLKDSTNVTTNIGYTSNLGSRGERWGGDIALKVAQSGSALFHRGADTNLTINGLSAGTLYHIYIVSYAHISGPLEERALGEWSTTNKTTTSGAQIIDSRSGLNGDTWESGVNYVLFENVEADTNGEIKFMGDAADGEGEYGASYSTRLHLNGFQIKKVIPEDLTIRSFAIPGSDGVIDQDAKTIALTAPYTPWGTAGLAALAPTFSLTTGSCNQTSGSAPSPTFAATKPVTYTVTDGTTSNNYAVTVTIAAPSTACDILTCDFGKMGQAKMIGTKIAITVQSGQSLTELAPTFTLSSNATINPASGSKQNLTHPLSYRVTAEDGTTFKDYTVTVQSYQAWTHSNSFFINTTPNGADIPAGATETNFPILLRLDSGTFKFSQAQPDGRDIRFATAGGSTLAYQIEEWDSAAETASIWIKIPTITGNARQELKMYWGNSSATSNSDGAAVFNASNGYASVIHMNETVTDAVGNLSPTDAGTTLGTGMIGKGRNFTAGKGIKCGANITTLPSGSNPHTTQAWFKAATAPGLVVCWGVDAPYGKLFMQFASPPRITVGTWFSGGDVTSASALATAEWIHVAHTYVNGQAKLYVNGVLDSTTNGGKPMNINASSRMYIGGFSGNYNFVGDIDEVRISKVTRSADWIKMEYESQKAQQTMVGHLVQPGSTLAVTPTSATIVESTSGTLIGQAGGAQKVYWIEKKNGVDTLLATDQFTLPVTAGRVSGDQNYTIQFKAIYEANTQTIDIPITITENQPDPVFSLTGPDTWDGRQTITITPNISNLSTLQAGNLADLNDTWSVNGVAVNKQITADTPTAPGTMTLTRSQGSGPMIVTLVLDNGGALVSRSKTITVTEPKRDPRLQRIPDANEKPITDQFYARDDSGFGQIYYNGSQSGTPDSVFLKVYTTDTGSDVPYSSFSQALNGGNYAFTAPIAPGRVTYKVTYGTTTGGVDTVLDTVTNLVCGDAYLIEGQSNAWATDSLPVDLSTDPWVRTYGHTTGQWGNAVSNGGDFTVGYWGYALALRLSTTHNMPICIINGSVGGTRIDQHQANPADHTNPAGTSYQIYATLLNRVAGAKLTHGIRGLFWHQGENNSGAAAPTGDYDYKSYQNYFVQMSADWKQDYPNIESYIIFQVMPKPCAMGPKGDQLREAQRTLPFLYSNMKILNTLGLPGYLGCHFSVVGYQNMSKLIQPVVEENYYGVTPAGPITAPNLLRAYFTSASRTEIALLFDQDMSWNKFSTANYFLDKVGGKVSSGSASGKVVTLSLSSAVAATATIDYLEDDHYNNSESVSSLLFGANAIPALTFADVPIAATPH